MFTAFGFNTSDRRFGNGDRISIPEAKTRIQAARIIAKRIGGSIEDRGGVVIGPGNAGFGYDILKNVEPHLYGI